MQMPSEFVRNERRNRSWFRPKTARFPANDFWPHCLERWELNRALPFGITAAHARFPLCGSQALLRGRRN